MKRKGNLFELICHPDNLREADRKARKGKLQQPSVKDHIKNEELNIIELERLLRTKTFKTSEYQRFIIREPKEREIYKLPYYPDRIVHHAILNILEPIFIRNFTKDTYSSIKHRGIHLAVHRIKRDLKNVKLTKYCLKLDIRKFYPSIDNDILKALLRKLFKDADLLWLLDEIVDSTEGMPIGNYLSQYFANYYLSGFDHWVKETKRVKSYYRYADDIVILAETKEELHVLLHEIKEYLTIKLNLQVKKNYQIFPVAKRGIDFLGYKFYHTHTLLRKSIKKRFARAIARGCELSSIASYKGWAIHANTKNLIKKLLNENV